VDRVDLDQITVHFTRDLVRASVAQPAEQQVREPGEEADGEGDESHDQGEDRSAEEDIRGVLGTLVTGWRLRKLGRSPRQSSPTILRPNIL
jgi:hypothetical protein